MTDKSAEEERERKAKARRIGQSVGEIHSITGLKKETVMDLFAGGWHFIMESKKPNRWEQLGEPMDWSASPYYDKEKTDD